jgi:hypothetical protein
MAINRYRWLANTPRAHITNQRTMEVLRDLGREVEDEAYMFAAHQDLMGENVFCESLAGEEIGRMKSWGNHPLSKAEHLFPPNDDERPAADLHGAAPVQDCLLARHAGADVDRVSQPCAGRRWRDHHLPDRLSGKEIHHPVEIPDRR